MQKTKNKVDRGRPGGETMKRLIINADDFGLTPGVSRGIAHAMKCGVVTSTTVMGNMPGLEEHLTLLQGISGKSVGAHLTLSAGRPLMAPDLVPSLVNSNGYMRRNFREAVQAAEVRHVEMEWRAQIERIVALGVKPTHLDSHHHVHLAPKLVHLALRLAKEYEVPAIRRLTVCDVIKEDNLMQNVLALPLVLRSQIAISQSDINYPRGLMSLSMRHLRGLTRLPDGVYEIFCHPGFVDDELRTKSSLLHVREEELAMLTSNEIQELIEQSTFQLVSYAIYGE